MLISIKEASKKSRTDWRNFIDRAIDKKIKFYVKVKKGTVFSFVKECVGRPNRISYSAGGCKYPGLRLSNEGMYVPVKHEDVVALELDEKLVLEVRRGIDLDVALFFGGIKSEKDGDLKSIYTIERNYIPGARDFYQDGFFSDDSLEKIKQGGVCEEEGLKDHRGSGRLATVIKDIGQINLVGKDDFVFMSGLYRNWKKAKDLDLYLSRSGPIVRYSLGVYEGEVFHIKDDYLFICSPKKVEVVSDKIFILERDFLALDEKKNDQRSPSEEDVSQPLLNLCDVPGYEESSEIARQWICKLAGVEDKDLRNAVSLVELATVAVMVWGDVRRGGMPDKRKCKSLVHAMNSKRKTYSGHFVRIITQNFRPTKKYEEVKSSSLIGRGERDWENTGVAALIEVWKKHVYDLSRTARKKKYRDWASPVTAALERSGIKDYMSNAAISAILSDQDRENIIDKKS